MTYLPLLWTFYTYFPCGDVTADGDAEQPIQWSGEFYDGEPGLVYYNYRYYNLLLERRITRDIENRIEAKRVPPRKEPPTVRGGLRFNGGWQREWRGMTVVSKVGVKYEVNL